MASTAEIRIEVVFAAPQRQRVIALTVAAGTTLYEAVLRAGIAAEFPGEIDPEQTPMGIFGQLERAPKLRQLQDGDRIEIYRPLVLDPKEARRLRAQRKLKRQRAAQQQR